MTLLSHFRVDFSPIILETSPRAVVTEAEMGQERKMWLCLVGKINDADYKGAKEYQKRRLSLKDDTGEFSGCRRAVTSYHTRHRAA